LKSDASAPNLYFAEAHVTDPTYSIVIPVYNEEETLRELQRRLSLLFDSLDGPAEVLLVDDGSTDSSYLIAIDFHRLDPRFKVIGLSRNFGHQLAITAGLDLALGDAVIVMDADLQHPPEVILEMAKRWREGYEVVYGVMEGRTESMVKRRTARGFYWLLRRLTDVEVPPAAGDFRLVDRKALDAFRAMRERNRYLRGMFSWIGYRQVGVPYQCPPRFAGYSKYTLPKMMKLALDGIVGFSNLPLQLVLKVGFAVSAASFLIGVVAIAVKIGGVFAVPGWASIVVIVSFMGGAQLVVLGVMGEYVARIYDEVRLRPLYLLRDLHGFDDEQVAALERRNLAVR
jgi:dolichol-phosphate mannosyltransferase